MGQVISAALRPVYPNEQWGKTYNNKVPQVSDREVLIEYTAHPEARFHLPGGKSIPVAKLESAEKVGPLQVVPPALQRVTIRVVEKASRKAVPVKLHVHGQAGEYLSPVDRHRIPNPFWFQDYSVDFTHEGIHHCTYITGETTIDLPLGKAYVEISKGFEIQPIRQVVRVSKATREFTFEIEKVLPWREGGWVTADTHVHFLSPHSALLEGAGEGVNVVNLLASQWGELMTNVGDFDGKTTLGEKEAGGDGEHLVRVGTENRQHVLGHISLLGYNGNIHRPDDHGRPGRVGPGRRGPVPLNRVGAAMPQAGRRGDPAPFPQSTRRACRHDGLGQRRWRGDDQLGRSLPRHRSLFPERLVSLSQLRVHGSRRGRHETR